MEFTTIVRGTLIVRAVFFALSRNFFSIFMVNVVFILIYYFRYDSCQTLRGVASLVTKMENPGCIASWASSRTDAKTNFTVNARRT